MTDRHVSYNIVKEKYTILYLENERLRRYRRFNKHTFEKQYTRMEKYGCGSRYNPYPTAFPYGNGMILHFYQQQERSTTKTVHKVINKGLKAYV